jgi:hypothetical protein
VNESNDNNNNNNNKKRQAEAAVSSTSNKSSVKYNSNVFHGLHDQLDVGLGIPITAKEKQQQAQLYQKVVDLLKQEDCPYCYDIKCTTKIPNAFTLALGKKVGFFEDRIHKDSRRDMYNKRYSFHHYWCLVNKFYPDITPPPECLKKLLTNLFPAPMHLNPPWKPVGENHFLQNNPNRFVFDVASMNALFPLKDEDFINEEEINAEMMK